jgi:Transcriptional regulators
MLTENSGNETPARATKPQRRRKVPTIQDVAHRANVAVGTVSRVINDTPGVKLATRQRVLAAIHELDYSPDPIARSMTSKRTGSIGVVVPYFTRPFFSEILETVEIAITQTGREFVLYNVRSHDQSEEYFRILSKQRKVDGLLIISIYPDDAAVAGFRRFGLPTVLVDAYHPLLPSFVVDNIEGAARVVRYLVACGHRRIGFINGISEGHLRNSATERLIGLQRAYHEMGIPFDPQFVLASGWNRQGGREAALQLLGRADRPTAIFAASDLQAVGVLEAAKILHIAVPADLSLVGYDGIELSEIMELSTIQQPIREMGHRGIQKLFEQIENAPDGESVAELILMKPELVIRHTSSVLQSHSSM